ncbi:hypothetical protein RM543_10240 [Roseicyclus sp. F158]|uniref:Uncharacterized protein n=1 Tax=Tropicimonas omnivorans TaxID=3075590 RepID=A0ABU3DIY8_9RHOB|nr:hypothetical protein [Roseicyclus sp. F158]MDT0683067.1 hypothetical protein [Roseicyclus sp. F158]
MKSLILALVVLAAPATAENVKIFVVQKDGGVIVKPGNGDVREAALILGDKNPPPGATGIVIERSKPARWTDLSDEDVHRKYGGVGDPVTELFPEEDTPTEPIEVFPEAQDSSPGIAPRAGNWIGKVVLQEVSADCPAGIAEGVAGPLAALDGSPVPGTIDASFSPEKIYPSLSWTRESANSWRSTTEMGQGPALITVQFAIQIMSPERISSKQLASIGGSLFGDCKSRMEVDLLWQE